MVKINKNKLKVVLVPKLTNPFMGRFFDSRYVFDTGVLALASYVRKKADIKIKSIFGHLGKKYLKGSDKKRISSKEYLYDFVNYILKESPDIVGLSCLDTSVLNTVILTQAIKKENKDIQIVLGGPGVFYNFSELMTNFECIDYCIIGEGEIALDKLVGYLDGRIEIENVPGLAYKKKSEIFINEPGKLINVNELPYLNFDLYDVPLDSIKSVSCETGRGCPFQCTFCSTTAFWGNRSRVKTAKRVADEIDHYCRLYQKVTHFDFHSHDNFLTSKKYIRQLYREFEKRKIEITWNCSSRIDRLDDEFINILNQSGCNYIDCGPESGSRRVRKLINKNINYENTITNIKKLIHNNIGVAVNFMFGFPTETIEEIEETFEQACTCSGLNADVVFCFLSPIKGTKIYHQFEDLLTDKSEQHLHDFTDTRASFLFGSDTFRKEHPYFKNREKMFRHFETYDAIIGKIRKTDSVHVFIHLSKFLLALKQRFGIDIYKAKAALETFPYSEDLFRFAFKQAEENAISTQAMAIVLYNVLLEQVKYNRRDFEDITGFILLDQLVNQEEVYLIQWDCFFRNVYNEFFKDVTCIDMFPDLFELETFQLCSAFKIKSVATLFMRFSDKTTQEHILTGIKLDKHQTKKIFYYKEQINRKEILLLKRLEKLTAGEENYA